MAGASSDAQALAISGDDWETVSESSEAEVPGGEAPGEEPCMVPPRCVNCEVYNWKQKKCDPDVLLRCPGCGSVLYCSKDCRKEHWVKVHKNHCVALAGTAG